METVITKDGNLVITYDHPFGNGMTGWDYLRVGEMAGRLGYRIHREDSGEHQTVLYGHRN